MSARRTCLVLGGSGSGKSEFAQRVAARWGEPVIYLATGKAEGPEMAWRVRKHMASRPRSWLTVEAPRSLVAALDAAPSAALTVLLEDVGSLTANCLPWIEEADGEQTAPHEAEEAALVDLLSEINGVLDWCEANGKHLVVVSSEVGLGFLPSSPVSRLYKDVIGDANQLLSGRVERTFLVVAGLPLDLSASAGQIEASLDLCGPGDP